MKTAKLTSKPRTDLVSRPVSLEEQIRCRAYEIYQAHGKTDGHDLEDWLIAEGEITSVEVRQKAS
jgi:hypothetical protein